MKRVSLTMVIFVLAVAVGGCAGEPAAPPTELPTAGPTPEPTAARPPASASLGDTWVRPADGMAMVFVAGGEFVMGSDDDGIDIAMSLCNADFGDCTRGWFVDEQPAHTVSLGGFWIDQTEVTNAQYSGCVEAGACSPPGNASSRTRAAYYGSNDYAEYPVIYINWHQAVAYCAWAGGRLPTEAEWEYAARGPEGRAFPWGDGFDGAFLNYCDANCELDWRDVQVDDGHADTAPAGSYSEGASWCGAYDLAGNVWEWVADRYAEYTDVSQVNPTGPSEGDMRGVRGGSWNNESVDTRGAYRSRSAPETQSYSTGFRCAGGTE